MVYICISCQKFDGYVIIARWNVEVAVLYTSITIEIIHKDLEKPEINDVHSQRQAINILAYYEHVWNYNKINTIFFVSSDVVKKTNFFFIILFSFNNSGYLPNFLYHSG